MSIKRHCALQVFKFEHFHALINGLSLHKQPFVTAHFQFITAHFVRHCALKMPWRYCYTAATVCRRRRRL